jgi:ketosteroid isomerase-like protein
VLHFTHVAAGLCLIVVAGCNFGDSRSSGEGTTPTQLTAADMAAIRAADSSFAAAANAGDVDALVAVYTRDASLLAPNLPPQKGQAAIRSFWGGFLNAYKVKFELASDTIEGRGDLAYNVGRFRYTAVPKAQSGAGVADEGKFLEVLKKQPDGSWKYVVDMYSSNLAPQH